jgi:hypothetical protein
MGQVRDQVRGREAAGCCGPAWRGRRHREKEIEEEIEEEFVWPRLDSVLKNTIAEAKQVFILDVNPDSLTEEAWEMCDSIERFIASRCDGLIWVKDDGIFDANLQRVATAKRVDGSPL